MSRLKFFTARSVMGQRMTAASQGGRGEALPCRLPCRSEVSECLVGSPAFKAGGTGDPRPAGSIPVHLRHSDATVGTPTRTALTPTVAGGAEPCSSTVGACGANGPTTYHRQLLDGAFCLGPLAYKGEDFVEPCRRRG